MSLTERIKNSFCLDETFSLKQLYNKIPDKPSTTLRARIYEGLGIDFERVGRVFYKTVKNNSQCVIIEGDGRNLDMLKDNSIDAIITDHPWLDNKSNIGGDRKFTDTYDCFEYRLEDFKEKARVLKEGSFLVEILPAENENNYEYLYKIKQMAKQCGLNYYSKVPWIKSGFVSNTGRKAKNTEDIMIFTKGKARKLRIDVKKTNQTGIKQFMSGTNKILPTAFNVKPVSRNNKIHQSEKPVELFEQILDFITKPNETVLDQFSGSGSVGEACLNKGRNCILIEKSKDNIDKIKNRLFAERICLT